MISREELYALVWEKPMTKVAAQFGVSNSYLARVCGYLNVPRPDRGYWTKMEVGKAPQRPPLPEAQPGDQQFWNRGDEVPQFPKPKLQLPVPMASRSREPRSGTHKLIMGARGHFDAGRKVEDGAYLRPYKRLLVDVTSSKASLEKALQFANSLFNALESEGHRVVLSPADAKLYRDSIDEREIGRAHV